MHMIRFYTNLRCTPSLDVSNWSYNKNLAHALQEDLKRTANLSKRLNKDGIDIS